jgi:hypothetical protein
MGMGMENNGGGGGEKPYAPCIKSSLGIKVIISKSKANKPK